MDFKCNHRVCTFYVESMMRNDTIRKLRMLGFKPYMSDESVKEFIDGLMKIYKYQLRIGGKIIDINNIEYNGAEGVIKCMTCDSVMNLILEAVDSRENSKIILDGIAKYSEKFFDKTILYFSSINGTYGKIKMMDPIKLRLNFL